MAEQGRAGRSRGQSIRGLQCPWASRGGGGAGRGGRMRRRGGEGDGERREGSQRRRRRRRRLSRPRRRLARPSDSLGDTSAAGQRSSPRARRTRCVQPSPLNACAAGGTSASATGERAAATISISGPRAEGRSTTATPEQATTPRLDRLDFAQRLSPKASSPLPRRARPRLPGLPG